MKTTKSKKRLLLIFSAFLCLTGASVYTVFIRPNQNTEKWVYLETTVEQGDIKTGVTENGSLHFGITSQMYDLDLSTDTDEEDDGEDEEEEALKYLEVEDVYVVAGQRISEGDKIMKFTDKSVEAIRRKLTGAKTEAEVELEEAQADYHLSAISAKETYDLNKEKASDADALYQSASQTLQNTIAKNQVEILRLQAEIANYQEKAADAQEDYDEAQKDYDEAAALMEELGTSNWIVTAKYEPAYLQAKNAREQAKNNLDTILNTIENDYKEIEALQKQIEMDTASLNVDLLEAKNDNSLSVITGSTASETWQATLESLQTGMNDAQEKLNILEDKLDAFEDFIGDGTIYAKGSGIVTEVGFEPEDILKTSGVIVSFAKENEMTITVDVTQEDITSLSVGDPVEIEFSAYEGQLYEGNITSITTTEISGDSVTVSYPVEVSVKGDTSILYGGMSAEVVFVTQKHTDTLYVAKKAIVKQNGKTYVTVKNGSEYELQEVETGISNSASTEILSGLSAGDTVYIASPVSNNADEEKDSEKPDENQDDTPNNDFPDAQQGGMPDMWESGGAMPMPGGMR